MVHNFRTLMVCASFASVGVAQALVVIDNFSTPQPRITLNTVMRTTNTVAGGAFAFETRSQTLIQDSNLEPPVARSTSVIRSGSARYSSEFEVDGRYWLTYYQSGNSGIDLGGLPAFRLNFLSSDHPFTLSATVAAYNSDTASREEATATAVVKDSLSPFSVVLDGWSTPVTWTNIVAVQFNFDPPKGGDFAVDQIDAVPEPASMLALGAGVAALLARRRRR